MPELPDLEVFARNLQRTLAGRQIINVEVHRPKRVRGPAEGTETALKGRKFDQVERVSKEVWFRLDNGRTFSVHLMLNGGFYVSDPGSAPKLRAITMHLDDGNVFGYVDPRGLAILQFDPKEPEAPDALQVTKEDLQAILRRKSAQPIKAVLVDQSLIGGIGNAYADEILWHARIHPASKCGKLPIEKLHSAMGEVLRNAIERIIEIDPKRIAGEERSFFKVHTKERDKSPTGHKIVVEDIASKQTYFTDEQKKYL